MPGKGSGASTHGGPDIIRFEAGILGFEDVHAYRFAPCEGPFYLLTAVDGAELGFVVTDPWLFRPDYAPEIWEEDAAALGLRGDDPVSVWVIVTLAEDPNEITANLQAPLVINARTGAARQVVQREGSYSTRHRVAEELQRARALGLMAMRRASGPEVAHSRLIVNGKEVAQAPLVVRATRQSAAPSAGRPARRRTASQAPLRRRG